MIRLNTRGEAAGLHEAIIGKVVSPVAGVDAPRPRLLVSPDISSADISPLDIAAVITSAQLTDVPAVLRAVPVVHSCEIDHIGDGDVLRVEPSGTVRTLYRRRSSHNTLFATERCNSLCVMCSQPPRAVDDDWRVEEMLQTIALADKDTAELGISGGEPTLLGGGLLRVIAAARDNLPTTAIHVLSNGRLFRYAQLAQAVGDIHHPDVMFGVPLYSDIDHLHDYVVQSEGAFEDTIIGLHNLARSAVPVEIRVVLHRHTYARLQPLAEFIYRNLTFASHVAFMGLEATGYAKANMDDLWIDPMDYQEQLASATAFLDSRGMRASIYNHSLCVVPRDSWRFCRQSISDWKNEFHPACALCSVRSECGGFFGFNLRDRISRGVVPIQADANN